MGAWPDMANTQYIKEIVEPHLRKWLGQRYQVHDLQEREVQLATGGRHKFDAVSDDGKVVADFVSNRPKTRTGRRNSGGTRKALVDLLVLNLLPSESSGVLVFTDADFKTEIEGQAERLGIRGVRLVVCSLPDGIQRGLDDTLRASSSEQRAAGD